MPFVRPRLVCTIESAQPGRFVLHSGAAMGLYQQHRTELSEGRLSMLPRKNSENRKERRYTLRLPVRLTVQDEGSKMFDGVSENISAHGILLQTADHLAEGTNVKLSVEVASTSRPCHLAATGTVVRAVQSGSRYALAVCCHKSPFLIRLG